MSERTNVVVLCTDANFFLPCAFLVEQLAAASAADRYDIAVIHEGVPEEKLARLQQRVGRPIIAIPFHAGPAQLPGQPPAEHVSRATYIRLHLHKLLAPHYRRILYLDSDIAIESPGVGGLFDLDLGGAAFAAAQDGLYIEILCPEAMPDLPLLRRDRDLTVAYKDGLGLGPGDPYLNSGVMLIDRARWEALEIPERALQFALSYPERCMIADQSAINAVAGGQWSQLSPQWNFQGTHLMAGVEDAVHPIVRHFAGPYKPWNTEAWGTRQTRMYHDWLAVSGWPGTFPPGASIPIEQAFGKDRRRLSRFFGPGGRLAGAGRGTAPREITARHIAKALGAKRRAALRHAVLAVLTFGRFVDLAPLQHRRLLKAVAEAHERP